MKKKKDKNDIPNWLNMAMRGVVCWIGWRRSFYRMHNLVEGAIVAEVCNIIAANLGDGQQLICEKLYKEINPNFPIGKSPRADLAIVQKQKKSRVITHVIEVKRSSSAKILDDVERLGELKLLNPEIKTYLLIVSEQKRPCDYVTENGCAVRNVFKHKVKKNKYEYNVRRVVKMSHTFKKKNHAHYACILEIL